MFKKTPLSDWSNKETSSIATVYQEDFRSILRNKKNIFKSVRDVSESFREHVSLSAFREEVDCENLSDHQNVNWSEIATAFVLDNPIWTNN